MPKIIAPTIFWPVILGQLRFRSHNIGATIMVDLSLGRHPNVKLQIFTPTNIKRTNIAAQYYVAQEFEEPPQF